ncbi:unnamed protein product [Linum trigynum]|uniref:Uncharacterized protein n=1 Tax=Linum trigynum TaxID=586398 RepID=A0AAV2F7P6_9ROSI
MVAAMLLGLEFPKNIAHSANSLTLIEEMATILPSGLIIGPHQLFSLTPSHESLSPPLSLKLVSLMFPTPLHRPPKGRRRKRGSSLR